MSDTTGQQPATRGSEPRPLRATAVGKAEKALANGHITREQYDSIVRIAGAIPADYL
jgi:hypothetical protein